MKSALSKSQFIQEHKILFYFHLDSSVFPMSMLNYQNGRTSHSSKRCRTLKTHEEMQKNSQTLQISSILTDITYNDIFKGRLEKEISAIGEGGVKNNLEQSASTVLEDSCSGPTEDLHPNYNCSTSGYVLASQSHKHFHASACVINICKAAAMHILVIYKKYFH